MNKSFQIVIDQGNSYTKIAIFADNVLIHVFRLRDNEIAGAIAGLHVYGKCTDGIFSSVRSEKDQLISLPELDIPILRFTNHTGVPIKIEYKTPLTLGRDRIANACAAKKLYGNKPVLVVDCGTCITYTTVNDEKLIGGAISPGLHMRYKSLNYYTGRLPLLDPYLAETPLELAGSSTESSIHSGLIIGTSKEISGMIEEYCSQFTDLIVILTGGDMSFFEPRLKCITFANPNLTLTGLHEILVYNRS